MVLGVVGERGERAAEDAEEDLEVALLVGEQGKVGLQPILEGMLDSSRRAPGILLFADGLLRERSEACHYSSASSPAALLPISFFFFPGEESKRKATTKSLEAVVKIGMQRLNRISYSAPHSTPPVSRLANPVIYGIEIRKQSGLDGGRRWLLGE